MSDSQKDISIGELLAHHDWVRSVARRLLGDGGDSEDAEQETWVSALRKPPGNRSNLRGWLARATLNRAREAGRRNQARTRREQTAARPEAMASTADLVERAEAQQEVTKQVLALEEPFRSVVLLRFYEGLKPSEVAERLDIPVKTVHSRLQRSLEKLRGKLDREYGDRAQWSLVLAPLVSGPGLGPPIPGSPEFPEPLGAPAAQQLAAGKWLAGSLAAAATVATVLWTAPRFDPPARDETIGPAATSSGVVAGPGDEAQRTTVLPALPEVDVATSTGGRIPRGVEAPSVPEPTSDLSLPVRLVRGRVVDMGGAPIAGIQLVLDEDPGSALAVTDVDGRFEVDASDRLPARAGAREPSILRISDPDWTTVRQCPLRGHYPGAEYTVVAAPATWLEGHVQDLNGVPIEGAEVELLARGNAFFGFPHALDLSTPVERKLVTWSGGRFAFQDFPEAPGLHLSVRARGFENRRVVLDEVQWPLVVQLSRATEQAPRVLEGIVLDRLGMPVPGAAVRLGDGKVHSDELGRFRMSVGELRPSTHLCAAKVDHLPALVEDFDAVVARVPGKFGKLDPVELVLGGAPREIRGRVLDADGAPCVGWEVQVTDPTLLQSHRMPARVAENLADEGEPRARTDSQGTFTLKGLFPRAYTVLAFESGSLRNVRADVGAEQEHVLLRPVTEDPQPVRGIVVDRQGRPVSGVQISERLDLLHYAWGRSFASGAVTFSDSDGTFLFDRAPAERVYLTTSGPGLLPSPSELPAHRGEGPVVLQVDRRCSFRIEVAAPAPGQVVTFEDAHGEVLRVQRFESGRMTGFASARVHRGNSEVLAVSERAHVAVLWEMGAERSRQPVQLDPERVNLLRF